MNQPIRTAALVENAILTVLSRRDRSMPIPWSEIAASPEWKALSLPPNYNPHVVLQSALQRGVIGRVHLRIPGTTTRYGYFYAANETLQEAALSRQSSNVPATPPPKQGRPTSLTLIKNFPIPPATRSNVFSKQLREIAACMQVGDAVFVGKPRVSGTGLAGLQATLREVAGPDARIVQRHVERGPQGTGFYIWRAA
jgi:hypothetical protein